MDFHGHKIDVDKAIQEIALEYAKRDLDKLTEAGKIGIAPQDTLSALSDSYFEACGWLCGLSEDYFRTLMENRYNCE